jgi:hypothetical protein
LHKHTGQSGRFKGEVLKYTVLDVEPDTFKSHSTIASPAQNGGSIEGEVSRYKVFEGKIRRKSRRLLSLISTVTSVVNAQN